MALNPVLEEWLRQVTEAQNQSKVNREHLAMELHVDGIVLQADIELSENSADRLVNCQAGVPLDIVVHNLIPENHHFLLRGPSKTNSGTWFSIR